MYCVCNKGIKKPLKLGIEYTGFEMPCLLAQPINMHVYTHMQSSSATFVYSHEICSRV